MPIHLLSNIQSPSLSVFYVTIFLIRSRIVFVAYQTTDSFTVVSFHLYVIVKDLYVISTASFCRRETGERKKWWEWRCEEKERLTPFPSSHRPPRAFFYALFSLEYRAGAPAKDYVHLLAFTFTIRTIRTVMTFMRRKRQQRGVCVCAGGEEAVFTPILGSWRFLPPYFPPNMRYTRS